jgi:hypothetical protein
MDPEAITAKVLKGEMARLMRARQLSVVVAVDDARGERVTFDIRVTHPTSGSKGAKVLIERDAPDLDLRLRRAIVIVADEVDPDGRWYAVTP